MDTGLRDKIVLITGAANGIGRSTAIGFAREGAHLGLLDIDEAGMNEVKAEAEALGARVALAAADLSTSSGVAGGMDALLEGSAGRSTFSSTTSAPAQSGASTTSATRIGTRPFSSTS